MRQNGTVAWAANYTPFGEAQITVSSIPNNFRFWGQYYDQETGLHYNYFRYYNPKIGRYLQADPIGQRGGLNLYTYASNDPANLVDPYGLTLGAARGPACCVSSCAYFVPGCHNAGVSTCARSSISAKHACAIVRDRCIRACAGKTATYGDSLGTGGEEGSLRAIYKSVSSVGKNNSKYYADASTPAPYGPQIDPGQGGGPAGGVPFPSIDPTKNVPGQYGDLINIINEIMYDPKFGSDLYQKILPEPDRKDNP